MSSPFYIFVDIFRIDGSRALVDDTIIIQAFDEELGTLTFLGQLDVTTVGRQQVFFTHAPHSYPSGRLRPNVQLRLINSSSLIVHTTNIYEELQLGSTIKVILGEGDSLLGIWTVRGTVTNAQTSAAITVGEVQVLLATGVSQIEVGTASLNGSGEYTLTIDEQFVPVPMPPPPTFIARYKDVGGVVRAQSTPTTVTGQEAVIHLSVPSVVNPDPDPDPEQYIVRGFVRNTVSAVLPNLLVEAVQLQWVDTGLQETPLGRVLSDSEGFYEIRYSPVTDADSCSPVNAAVTLVVRVLEGTVTSPGEEIERSGLVSPADPLEVVDLTADLDAPAGDSEFVRIDRRVRHCLAADEARFRDILWGFRDKPGHLEFGAIATGVEQDALLAFALANVIAHEVNTAIAWGSGSPPISEFGPIPAEVVFALTRAQLASSLVEAVQVAPEEFLATVTEAIRAGTIDADFEGRLPIDIDDSLPGQWALVRAHYLSSASVPDALKTDEYKLLALVLPEAQRKTVAERQSEYRGDFREFVEVLRADSVLTAQEAENLLFAFEFYSLADDHYPITAIVYGHKAARGWKTAADLAGVARETVSGVDGWNALALEQAPSNFPKDVFGRSDEEKATAHGRRLYEAFTREHVENRFALEAATFAAGSSDDVLEAAAEFLVDHPEFVLESTHIPTFLEENDVTLDEDVLNELKKLQRLRRLTPKFGEAMLLAAANFDSAVSVARVPHDEFVAQLEQSFEGDIARLSQIHQTARRLASEVMAQVVRFSEHLNDMGGADAIAPYTVDEALSETTNTAPRFARYATLFGNLFSCASRHCETVLSPAAYLVDLLEFLEGKPRTELLRRRPDLAHIELNCENTNTVQPYIDLVIERLGAVLAPWQAALTGVTATQLDDAAGIPRVGAPSDARALALQEIRARVREAGYRVTSRLSVRSVAATSWLLEDDAVRFRVDGTAPFTAYGEPQTSANADGLDVFPEHENPQADAILEAAVFPLHLPLALGRREMDLVTERWKLTRAAIVGAFPGGLTPGAPAPNVLELVDTDEEAQLVSSLLPAEQDALLSSTLPAREYWGFDADDVENLPRPEAPGILVSGHWQRVLAQMSFFLNRSQLTYAQVLDLLSTEFVHDPEHRLVVLTADVEEESAENARECNYYRYVLRELDGEQEGEPQTRVPVEATYRRLSHFLRLWRHLAATGPGWDMRTVDRYLMTFEQPSTAPDDVPTLPTNLKRLARVRQFAEWLSLEPREVMTLFAPLDVRRSTRLGPSSFELALLAGPRSARGYQILERLGAGGSTEETTLSSADDLDSFRSTLRTALRLPRIDFDHAFALDFPSLAGGYSTPFTPTVEQLSSLVRRATWARAQGLSVLDAERARVVLGIDPFDGGDIDARMTSTLSALQELRAWTPTGLPLETLEYLLRSPENGVMYALSPRAEQLDAVRRQLAAAAATIEQRYPASTVLDTDVLTSLLSQVMPLDKVPVVLAELVADAPDAVLLKRYFASFVDDVDVFVDDELLPVTPKEARAPFLGRRLRAFLVERERRVLAITVASEAFGLPTATTDYLLSTALAELDAAGVRRETGTALSNWVRAVGALDVDFEDFRAPFQANGEQHWVSNWVAPVDGEVRFVAEIEVSGPIGNEVTLSVGGVALDSTFVTEGTRTTITFAPIQVRVGEVRSFDVASTHDFAGALDTFRFRIQTGFDDPRPLSSASFSSLDEPSYIQLQKGALLTAGLRLDTIELAELARRDASVAANERLLDGLPLTVAASNVPWARVRSFTDDLLLHRRLDLGSEWTLFQLLLVGADAATVAELTGWDVRDVEAALEAGRIWTSSPSLSNIETWRVLERAIGMAQRVGLPLERAVQLFRATPTTTISRALRELLRAQYSAQAFSETFKPARDRLRQVHRDALVGYFTSHAIVTGPPVNSVTPTRHFVNENDLFGYYLIDVEMEPDTQISRLRLGLNVIQLFVQRIFLGLEPGKEFADADEAKKQWEWRQNYRVWEANRKVFLFPENWIEPQLRDGKTEIFKELEEALVQDDVDDAAARRILGDYVEKLDELTKLTVTGMHKEGSSVYIVARSRSQPYEYYHRRVTTNGSIRFTPWQKVPLEIESSFVTPARHAGALWLFWPMVREKQKPAPNDAKEKDVDSVAVIQLLWSRLDPTTRKWSKPKLGREKVIDYEPRSIYSRRSDQDSIDTSVYSLVADRQDDGGLAVQIFRRSTEDDRSTAGEGNLRAFSVAIRIGFFYLAASGAEGKQPDDRKFRSGAFYADRAILINNALRQKEDDFEKMEDRFRLGLDTYFDSVPGSQNFRYLADDAKFFQGKQPTLLVLEASGTQLWGKVRKGILRNGQPKKPKVFPIQFGTLGYPVMRQIVGRYRDDGPEGIMTRPVQALPSSDPLSFYYNGQFTHYGGLLLGYYRAGDKQAETIMHHDFRLDFQTKLRTVKTPHPKPTVEFDYGKPFAAYNWELFFHAPILIADRLAQQQRFDEALKWFHYVFDPRRGFTKYERDRRWAQDLPAGARYWNFLPFFANKDVTDSLLDVLGANGEMKEEERDALQAVIADWQAKPFNPHLIARQRIAAYQKFTVMKYLDTLIAWGDELFRQDTIESINRATQIYVLASEILGERPEVVQGLGDSERASYADLQRRNLDDFGNALVELEGLMVDKTIVAAEDVGPVDSGTEFLTQTSFSSLFFRIPRNDKLDGYWDTVGDRLFKIRNSMNIDGVKRALALFDPPIDPALLVRARANGVDLSSALSQLNKPLPHHRFSVWVAQAKELANELKSFSGALLGALEKKDAEELSLLRQEHELNLLRRVTAVREAQIRDAEQAITALRERRTMPLDRIERIQSRAFINSGEQTSMDMSRAATGLEIAGSVMGVIGGLIKLVPELHIGVFGVMAEFGGKNLEGPFNSVMQAAPLVANVLRTEGGIAGTIGSFERRKEEWDLQVSQAQLELKDIDQQLIGAEIRLDMAKKELANHELQIEQAKEVQEFLKDKFSNRELYQWMITQLTRSYQQAYKLAYDVAKTAERTFAFELGVEPQQFIQAEYRDSSRYGLLAGEKLFLDLKRMEVAYLEKDKRELEITKTISLDSLDPAQLQQLRNTGRCEFALPEMLFDLDFPGQYFRRIRAVRLTIPCVTGPYTSVSAKLSLLSSAVRVKSTANEDDYAYKGFEDSRFVHDTRGIQSIATSRAQDDSGLFELNFRDERYLPFEGAGVVSRWSLELPEEHRQFDYSSISDAVITISYTAREAGGTLKTGAVKAIDTQVNNLLKMFSESETGLVRVLSMKREFPDGLHQLLTSNTTTLTLRREHFPFVLRNRELEILASQNDRIDVIVEARSALTAATLTLTVDDEDPGAASTGIATLEDVPFPHFAPSSSLPRNGAGLLENTSAPGTERWKLDATELDASNTEDVILVVRYRVKPTTP